MAVFRRADGHGVVPLVAAGLQYLHQLHQRLVQVAGEHQLVDDQIVARDVGGHGPAVLVHDLAAGGGDAEQVVAHLLGFFQQLLPLHQLELHQTQDEDAHHHGGGDDQRAEAAGKAFSVHGQLPPLRRGMG